VNFPSQGGGPVRQCSIPLETRRLQTHTRAMPDKRPKDSHNPSQKSLQRWDNEGGAPKGGRDRGSAQKRKQPSEIHRLTSQHGAKPSKRSCLRRCLSRPIKTKAPRKPERFQISRSKPQAATLVGSASSTLSELEIGIARGFIASGISRTRSTCRSPFSSLAPLTTTWSASWELA
jgi:hypothetical protein